MYYVIVVVYGQKTSTARNNNADCNSELTTKHYSVLTTYYYTIVQRISIVLFTVTTQYTVHTTDSIQYSITIYSDNIDQ